jgi:sortase A
MPYVGKKVYIKNESFDPIYHSVNYRFFFKSRVLSGGLMAVGFLVLGTQVIAPLVFFKTQNEIAQPMRASVLGVATGYSDFEYKELKNDKSDKPKQENVPNYFYLQIPKLKISNAVVETNATTLNPETALGHYKGSSLPGDKGNKFIYGHSVLPWFFNPKNYKTIFSTLGDLNAGDEFYIYYNNNKLTYKVEFKEVVDPTSVNPLAEFKPDYLNESTVTLMTCWPAGTRAKRLLVRASLEKN